eukprot:3694341-Rhodomonas_salina.8
MKAAAGHADTMLRTLNSNTMLKTLMPKTMLKTLISITRLKTLMSTGLHTRCPCVLSANDIAAVIGGRDWAGFRLRGKADIRV